MKLDDDSKIGRTKHGGPATPAVIAFGKHPAWSDHINDPALVRKDTPELEYLLGLLQTRQYEEVIRRGTWAKLEEDRRHDEVDCLVVRWRRGAGGTTVMSNAGAKLPEASVVSFAEVWASADALGRSEQVFVIACDVQQEVDVGGLAELDEGVLAAKGHIKAAAAAANRAIESKRLGKPIPPGALEKNAAQDAVRGVIATLREQVAELDLTSTAAGPAAAAGAATEAAAVTGPAPVTDGAARDERTGAATGDGAKAEAAFAGSDWLVAGLAALGPDALYRVAYRFRSAYSKWQKSGQGQLIRVPAVGGQGPSEMAFGWRRLILTLVPGIGGLSMIVHRGIPAVDIILGDVGADHVEALRMNTKQLAPESEVPYSGATDAAFRELVDATLRGERTGILGSEGATPSSTITPPLAAPGGGVAGLGAGAAAVESGARPDVNTKGNNLKRRGLLIGLIGLAILVLLGVIFLAVRK